MRLEEFYKAILDRIYMYSRIIDVNPVCAVMLEQKTMMDRYIEDAVYELNNPYGDIEKMKKYLELAFIWQNLPITRTTEDIRRSANYVRRHVKHITSEDLDKSYNRWIWLFERTKKDLKLVCGYE